MPRDEPGQVGGFRPGDRIGPYEVLRRLGRGGMGEVYLARSRGGRPVAVKTLLSDGPLGVPERKRFAREIALARRVNGAFTADVIDADPEAGLPWMATEFISAPSLAELVRECGVLPPPAVLRVGAGIAEALVSLHATGIVHRDLKPSNVLLPGDGPRVIDFGISHAMDVTRTEVTLGTVAFTSPEQARGEPCSPASDVYALGATLFHLAVGRAPYPQSEPLELLIRVARGRLELAGLPRDLDAPVRGCLRFDPADRIGAEELLHTLVGQLDARPGTTGAAPWLPGTWRQLITRYAERGAALGGHREHGEHSEHDGHGGPGGHDGRPHSPDGPGAPARPQAAAGSTAPETLRAETLPAGPAAGAGGTAAGTGSRPPAGYTDQAVYTLAPDPHPAPDHRSAGRGSRARLAVFGATVVVLVALLVVLLDRVPEDRNQAEDPRTPSPVPSRTVSRTPVPVAPAEEVVTTRPADRFVDVRKGDCVNLAGTDDPNLALWQPWTKEELHAVPCTARNAYMRVTDVRWGREKCTREGGSGEFAALHADVNGEEIAVCLRRQFRVGQCFPALKARKDEDWRTQLLAVQPCRKSELSPLNNTMFRVTAVLSGTSPGTERRCPGAGYAWTLKDQDIVVCAAEL
ncbi:serine/threonine protein kinase [Streptomyces sp. NPDC018031]|uniref:serine/threonine protein kinase n=1 Tax=Streptomyces sp. NPDC018031 TaxID=3365033 RepID=UPI00379A39F3